MNKIFSSSVCLASLGLANAVHCGAAAQNQRDNGVRQAQNGSQSSSQQSPGEAGMSADMRAMFEEMKKVDPEQARIFLEREKTKQREIDLEISREKTKQMKIDQERAAEAKSERRKRGFRRQWMHENGMPSMSSDFPG